MPPNHHHQQCFTFSSTHPIIGMTITTTKPSKRASNLTTTNTNDIYSGKHNGNSNYDLQQKQQYRMTHRQQSVPPPPPCIEQQQQQQQHWSSKHLNNNDNDDSGSCSTTSNLEVMSITMINNNDYCVDNNIIDDTDNNVNYGKGNKYNTVSTIDDNHDDRYYSTTRTTAQQESQSQALMTARILACTSPEITSLLKRSQPQEQQPSKSITTNPNTAMMASQPDILVSRRRQQLLLPSLIQTTLSPRNINPERHHDHDLMDETAGTRTTTSPLNWTEAWLQSSSMQEDEVYQHQQQLLVSDRNNEITPPDLITSSPEQHCYNSSISDDSIYNMQRTTPSFSSIFSGVSDMNNNSTRNISSTTCTNDRRIHKGNATSCPDVVTNSLTKLTLHRRVSVDQLPDMGQLNILDNTSSPSTTSCMDGHHNSNCYGIETNTCTTEKTNPFCSNAVPTLNKLVLHKSVTIVSDDTAS